MTTAKPACCRAMFPDLSKLKVNTPCRVACVKCPHVRSCYALSVAKLALGHAPVAHS